MDKASIRKRTVSLGAQSYDILMGRGLLSRAGEEVNLNRRVFIVTDKGVPASYAKTLAEQCASAKIVTVEEGEDAKSLASFSTLCGEMLDYESTRTDCVVAIGGGKVGDLAGFVAACYMRGIDFYNIPTTVLSCVDSSVGGKTGVNLNGVKNCVGAFWQPKKVLVDPDLLQTLPPRQAANGLAEAVKMALTSDAALFSLFEEGDIRENLDTILFRSFCLKADVVEKDEKEAGLRRILNFGHTIGHGIEAAQGMKTFYHGECVGLGMLPMCSPAVRARLLAVMKKIGLPTIYQGNPENLLHFVRHDKKCAGEQISFVFVDAPGSCEVRCLPLAEFARWASVQMKTVWGI